MNTPEGRLIQDYIDAQEHQQALNLAFKNLKKMQIEGNIDLQTYYLQLISRTYFDNNLNKLAESYLNKAANLLLKESPSRLKAYQCMLRIIQVQKQVPLAINKVEGYKEKLDALIKDDSAHLDIYLEAYLFVAQSYVSREEDEKAIIVCYEGLEASQRFPTEFPEQVPLYLILANIFLKNKEYEKALKYSLTVKQISKKFNLTIYSHSEASITKKIYSQLGQNKQVTDPLDEASNSFIQKARDAIELELKNHKFGVKDLAIELEVSERNLFRKFKASLKQTPLSFIRDIRLKKAFELILFKQFNTVSEVASEVGYNNVSYFSKLYKDKFGILPSQSIKKNKI